jgi:NADH-quinone oxidoreductase subunit E
VDLGPLRKVLASLSERRGMLIPLLQEAQHLYGFVPEEAADLIADELGVYRSQVYGVLTFYAQFYLSPRGKHVVRVCSGTACHVRGGDRVISRVEKVLGVGHGGTTADGLFSYEKVACLGACGMAPLVMVDDDTHGQMDPAKMEKLLREKRRAAKESASAPEDEG